MRVERCHAQIDVAAGVEGDAGVGAFGNIAHRFDDVAFEKPCAHEIVHHVLDRFLARARHIRDLEGLVRDGVFVVTRKPDAEDVSPPVLESGPTSVVAVIVIARPHIGVRRAQMSIEQRRGKRRRAIVDVDIRTAPAARYRDLDRGHTTLLSVIDGITLVKNGIVRLALELAASLERFDRVHFQDAVHPKLPIPAGIFNLAADRLEAFDQVESRPER